MDANNPRDSLGNQLDEINSETHPKAQGDDSQCSCNECDTIRCFTQKKHTPDEADISSTCIYLDKLPLQKDKISILSTCDINDSIDKITFISINDYEEKDFGEPKNKNTPAAKRNSVCIHTHIISKDMSVNTHNIDSFDKINTTEFHSKIASNLIYKRKYVIPGTAKMNTQIMKIPYNDSKKSLSCDRSESACIGLHEKSNVICSIVKKLQKVYEACSCRICECVAIKSVTGNNYCKCEPCGCKDCTSTKYYTEWLNIVKSNKKRCADCQCSNRIEYAETCTCKPCECVECKSLLLPYVKYFTVAEMYQQNLYQCSPCDCNSNLMHEPLTGMTKKHKCPCENNICQIYKNKDMDNSNRDETDKPIEILSDANTHVYDSHRASIFRKVYSQQRKPKSNDTIAKISAISNSHIHHGVNKRETCVGSCQKACHQIRGKRYDDCINCHEMCNLTTDIDHTIMNVEDNDNMRNKEHMTSSDTGLDTGQEKLPQNKYHLYNYQKKEVSMLNKENLQPSEITYNILAYQEKIDNQGSILMKKIVDEKDFCQRETSAVQGQESNFCCLYLKEPNIEQNANKPHKIKDGNYYVSKEGTLLSASTDAWNRVYYDIAQNAKAFSVQLSQLLEKYENANRNFESISQKFKPKEQKANLDTCAKISKMYIDTSCKEKENFALNIRKKSIDYIDTIDYEKISTLKSNKIDSVKSVFEGISAIASTHLVNKELNNTFENAKNTLAKHTGENRISASTEVSHINCRDTKPQENNETMTWSLFKKNNLCNEANENWHKGYRLPALENEIKEAVQSMSLEINNIVPNNSLYQNKNIWKLEINKICVSTQTCHTITTTVDKEINTCVTMELSRLLKCVMDYTASCTITQTQTPAAGKIPGLCKLKNCYKNIDLGEQISGSCDALKVRSLRVRRISDHTVLVKWNIPQIMTNIQGYELQVDGRAVQQIFGPARRMAVITCLPRGDKTLVTIRTILSAVAETTHYPTVTICVPPTCPMRK